MTKKEVELQNRLLDLLEANTNVMEKVVILLTAGRTKEVGPDGPDSPDGPDEPPEPTEVTTIGKPELPIPGGKVSEKAKTKSEKKKETEKVDTKITPEYCRKALKAIRTKLSDDEAREFLARFGNAKTIPELDKKFYEEFIAKATIIMKGD